MRARVGLRVARAAGVESEMELAFAGLHQLCAPFAGSARAPAGPAARRAGHRVRAARRRRAGSLPGRARRPEPAVRRGRGAAAGLPRRRRAVARRAPRRRRWRSSRAGWGPSRSGWSSPSASRPASGVSTGCRSSCVDGLDDRDAQALLESVITGPLDERVRDRIVAETRGNPLALLELPRGLTPAELAGGFGLPDGPALVGPHRGELPRAAGAAAAGDAAAAPGRGGRAGRRSGAGVAGGRRARDRRRRGGAGDRRRAWSSSARRCASAIRSCARRSTAAAAPEERQRVHRALAEATDAEADPDRRAWHRAQATAGLDEDVAAELERSAGRARARGGLAAGAAFLERAAELTPDPARRAQRALAAAQGKHQAGAPDAALRLLAMAQAGPLDELDRARAQLLRAQIAFAATRGRDAPPLLLDGGQAAGAARRDARARDLPRRVRRGAVRRPPRARRRCARGRRRRSSPPTGRRPPPPRACDLLLDGLARAHAEGYAAGAPTLQARAARLPRRAAVRGGRAALAVARLPHRPGPRRRRGLGRAHRAPGRARPPRRRALAAARRARPTASASSSSPATSRPRRRWPPRRTRSSRPPAAT